MKKLFKVLFSKKVLSVFLLFIQISIFYLCFYALSEYALYIYGGGTALSLVVILIEINRESDSGIKLSWIILMAVMPVFGACLYAYIQMDVSSGKIRSRFKRVHAQTAQYNSENDYALTELSAEADAENGTFQYLQTYANAPVYKNTFAKYFPLGDSAYPVMLQEIKKARKFIFIEYFILNKKSSMWTSILSLLREKVREGVEVRVIYDGLGSMMTTPYMYREKLKKYGILCRVFAPVKPFLSTYQNNRDHRKIMVIDGKTAFTGGINLSDEYINQVKKFGHWKDNAIMLKGDAVRSFTVMFLRMWNVLKNREENYDRYIYERNLDYRSYKDGYMAPFDDSPLKSERIGKTLYAHMINSAERYVYIMTPYLVLDEEMKESLKFAAKRGVDVKLLLPHIPDKWYAFALARTYYPELIRAGVKIYEYTHGFVHSKTTVSDGTKAIVGTINYDYRSLYLHYECAVYLYQHSAIKTIQKDFSDTMSRARLFTLEDYSNSSIFMRFVGRVLRVFAPLM